MSAENRIFYRREYTLSGSDLPDKNFVVIPAEASNSGNDEVYFDKHCFWQQGHIDDTYPKLRISAYYDVVIAALRVIGISPLQLLP